MVPSPGREVRQTSDGLLCLPCPTRAWRSVGATGRVLGLLTNPEIVFAFIGRAWRMDDGGGFGHLEWEKTVLAPFWAHVLLFLRFISVTSAKDTAASSGNGSDEMGASPIFSIFPHYLPLAFGNGGLTFNSCFFPPDSVCRRICENYIKCTHLIPQISHKYNPTAQRKPLLIFWVNFLSTFPYVCANVYDFAFPFLVFLYNRAVTV